MFGKRKKEHKAQELIDSRIQVQKKFDEAIQSAAGIEDPAKKILALKKVGQQIVDQIGSEDEATSMTAAKAEVKARMFGLLPGIAGGLTVATLFTGPVGWTGIGVIWGGYALSSVFASKHGKAVEKKLQANAKDYIRSLNDQADLVGAIIGATIENNVQEISKSPLYPEVIDIPGLPEVFAAAAAKHIIKEKEIAAKAAADAEKKEPAEPRKKQPPKYDELKGL